MESNFSGLVNGFEYHDVGFGVPSSTDFDLHHHHQTSTHDHDHYYSVSADDIDSENTLLKYVNQLLMEESISEEEKYSLLALQQTEEMLQQVITDSSTTSLCFETETETESEQVFLYEQQQNMLPANEILVRSMFSDAESALQFKRGLEEASKFLPNTDQWIFNQEHEEKVIVVPPVKEENRVKKNHRERDEEEEVTTRSSKQLAMNVEDGTLTEMFDKVLLLDGECDPLSIEEDGSSKAKAKVAKRKGGRSKKKSQAVDFRTVLTLCAQSISSGDKITADDLLRQIRKQSSPLGDASQRVAYFFANALEARLQGSTGTMIQSYYDSITSKKRIAAHILKSYQVFLSSSPFMTLMYFFANKMILDAAKDASVLHIIDFGILYGFQWPMFIQHLSNSKTGPRKLRITGVELPQHGFRPTERIENTGRRLTEYCKRFGVPFEYNAIASKHWETIRMDEFKIRPNEVLAVNTALRLKNLRDVTPGEEDCPRDGFLKLIRDIKPDVFLCSTVNGSYNAPFFTTRFKEALFHYSALFDMFSMTLSRENPERIHFEGEFYGREIMNVIACEGEDRVERPETYKQWQVRMVRAGFKEKPVEANLVESFREKMKKWGYHKDFVLDEDSNWFLQGWKGRIIFSSSCWVSS